MSTTPFKVKITRWDCGKGHFHTTKEIAEKCMPMDLKDRTQTNKARDKRIIIAWGEGNKMASIARHHGISSSRVRDIVGANGRQYALRRERGLDIGFWTQETKDRFDDWKPLEDWFEFFKKNDSYAQKHKPRSL